MTPQDTSIGSKGAELASGYPGYNGVIPFENGFLSEMLIEHGYSTFMVGKYHLTPSNQETGAGPFDRWPLGRGFQRFYGFLGGDTSPPSRDAARVHHAGLDHRRSHNREAHPTRPVT
jgi:arylsulfatase A-like enzyme